MGLSLSALKGHNTIAQGNALGAGLKTMPVALKGRNTIAQGNALGVGWPHHVGRPERAE